ncbi:hypothetical protein J1614_000559 [Plenodomus biglobosus]|nr:hypothetical protein J1614_000559 [Plenodomus biglobosus]
MDFTLLEHVNFNPNSTNGTFSMPSAIMEALIPGYRILYQLFYQVFGIDIGLIMSGCLIAFAISQGIRIIYLRVHGYFLTHYTSTIYVEEYDEIYDFIIDWLASKRVITEGRGLLAVTLRRFQNKEAEDEDVSDAYGIFNFEKWVTKRALRFEPWYGRNSFSFEGRSFSLRRERPEGKRGNWDYLAITCTGRSYEPIKALLQYIRSWSRSTGAEKTIVYRAQQSSSNGYYWARQCTRPSRPLSTISLDEHIKANIVKDINEYLHPTTACWYAARGIPYRRGYLLYGPPGTGKTSISFALAGVFGLGIYCISLSGLSMTDSVLGVLFDSLPDRCIVLLEDVDSAGLRRENPADDSGAKDAKDTKDEKDAKDTKDERDEKDDKPSSATSDEKSDAGAKKSVEPKSVPTTKSSTAISMSGLLNVIDGAASQEGRVLIMTTNYPESLDDALIRPGRVDLKIGFTYATQEQAQDIFIRMYSRENNDKKKTSQNDSSSGSGRTSNVPPDQAKTVRLGGERFLKLIAHQPALEVVEPENLHEMAEAFAVQIPEDKFTPAEVQGYLLNLKREPSKAIEGVGKWRDDLLEAKKKGKKVVNNR